MSKVCFSFRFIIDRHFFNEVMKINQKVFLALMYISSCSSEFKREHNLMSERIRAEIIRENPTMGEEYIKSSLNKVNEPASIEVIEDEIVRNIKYAIHYTKASTQKITPMCILTSDSKKEEYLRSPHLINVNNVVVKSGDEAIELLEEYKKLAWE